MSKILKVVAMLMIGGFAVSSFMAEASSAPTPEQVVTPFQKLPHYEMSCQDESKEHAKPSKISEELVSYFSKEYLRLFLWSQCFAPEIPPHYSYSERGDEEGFLNYDIRFGTDSYWDEDAANSYIENIRVQKAQFTGADKATIKVLYGNHKPDMYATYTLIREDGQWKIDDIAPQGDYDANDEYQEDTALAHSDSTKADMQTSYGKANARYQKEKPSQTEITQVMSALMSYPHYDYFCKTENWKRADPNTFGQKNFHLISAKNSTSYFCGPNAASQQCPRIMIIWKTYCLGISDSDWGMRKKQVQPCSKQTKLLYIRQRSKKLTKLLS